MTLFRIFPGVLAATTALTLLAGPLAAQQDTQTPSALQSLRPVKLATIANETDVLVRRFFGQVVARETVDLAFQVGGQILDLPIVEGSAVAKGDTIAALDLEQFELQRDQAMLQLEQAQRTFERQKTLGATRVAQSSIDDAETAAKAAEIALRNAEYALERATLVAPFDGLVASRLSENFATVAAGTPVVRLHDLSELRVEIEVPEILFRQAQDDSHVSMNAILPGSDEMYPLEVREFKAETSTVGQTYNITLVMEPPTGQSLLPGASVTVLARRLSGASVIYIPVTAIVTDSARATYVMVYTPKGADQGKVTKTPVTLRAESDGRFILVNGLAPGAEIVVAGAQMVSDGEAVRRFSGFGN
ncbi:efflux RND transporter periplasmic adaptor subunit [Candidatus Halocynthiibacter alkanivorans]|uniref:efflux RND transporter periplasmic adaptor subunit n=1 Tax=Candidatus Halocynthiibacter alkanivorans TaxID=2267619 RepID=UPI000DF38198|nr:efflux RND transporter periplasmic adaptor subunit [Candidatus Halocynthiibacter alkanivorans]